MNWVPMTVIALCACLIWELDEQQVIKKHKKKKIEKKRQQNGN